MYGTSMAPATVSTRQNATVVTNTAKMSARSIVRAREKSPRSKNTGVHDKFRTSCTKYRTTGTLANPAMSTTRDDAKPIRMYKIVQTIGNTNGGGVHDGFRMDSYEIPGFVAKRPETRSGNAVKKIVRSMFSGKIFSPSRNGAEEEEEEEEEFVLNLFIKFKKMTSKNRSERVYEKPLYASGESATNRIASIFFDAPCTTSNPTRRVPLGHVNRSFFPFFAPPPLKTRLSNVT